MAIVLTVIVCATDLGLVLQEDGAALFSTFNTAPDSQAELANPKRLQTCGPEFDSEASICFPCNRDGSVVRGRCGSWIHSTNLRPLGWAAFSWAAAI
jgi:hypothetical protein